MDEVEVLDVVSSVQFLRTEALFATGEKTQSLLKAARVLEQLETKLGQAYGVAASLHWNRAEMSDEDVIRGLEYRVSDAYHNQFNVIKSRRPGEDNLIDEEG